MIKSQLLCQLSYAPTSLFSIIYHTEPVIQLTFCQLSTLKDPSFGADSPSRTALRRSTSFLQKSLHA